MAATHKCEACLKKTIEDAVEVPQRMVVADTECGPGRGHMWKEMGKNSLYNLLIM